MSYSQVMMSMLGSMRTKIYHCCSTHFKQPLLSVKWIYVPTETSSFDSQKFQRAYRHASDAETKCLRIQKQLTKISANRVNMQNGTRDGVCVRKVHIRKRGTR
jgi:hypothetical protein